MEGHEACIQGAPFLVDEVLLLFLDIVLRLRKRESGVAELVLSQWGRPGTRLVTVIWSSRLMFDAFIWKVIADVERKRQTQCDQVT